MVFHNRFGGPYTPTELATPFDTVPIAGGCLAITSCAIIMSDNGTGPTQCMDDRNAGCHRGRTHYYQVANSHNRKAIAMKRYRTNAVRMTRNEAGAPMRVSCNKTSPVGKPVTRAVRDWSNQSQTVNRSTRGGWKRGQIIMDTDGIVHNDVRVSAIKTSSADGRVYGKWNGVRVVRMGYMSACWKIIR